MRRLGAQLGIRGPSLYKHVASKEEIGTALAAQALADSPTSSKTSPAHSLTSPAPTAPRRLVFLGARTPPPLLAAQPPSAAPASLPAGLEDRAAAHLIDARGGDRGLARAAWATINGLIESEDDAVAAQLPAGPVAGAVRHSGRAAVEAALRSFFAPRSRADGTVRMGVVFRCYLAERAR